MTIAVDFKNVDIVFVGFPGGDATTNANYRITRGD